VRHAPARAVRTAMQLMVAGSVETHDHTGGARLRVKLSKINRSGFEKTK